MSHVLEDLKTFLDTSPTSWHATKQIGNRLALHDYTPLQESEKWNLEKGKKYFVHRGGSFCAFHLPSHDLEKAFILAAHTDSPALKIKPHPESKKENMTLFGVEVYGSPILNSWLNRDLCIAGRVVVADSAGNIEQKLVTMDDVAICIPQLALHLDREVNEKGLQLNKQEHLPPLICLDKDSDGTLETLLRRHLAFHTLLSFDLFVVPMETARFLGASNEMLASYRIDNLVSVHAAITALAMQQDIPQTTLPMTIFWDHEEIGSKTLEGADSSFVSDIFSRLYAFYHKKAEEQAICKSKSLCLSLDMAHALHPSFPKKHDPNHQPLLGKGIVIKYNADYKYATSALSSAPIVQLCRENNIAYQQFVARSDMPSGSTVGPIFSRQMGMNTVDIGCPQLSMHAARELIACQDHVDLCMLLAHGLKKFST